jgi:hypothetical protein
MRKRNMYVIAITIILCLVAIPLIVNRIYSSFLNKTYTDLNEIHEKGYIVKKVPLKGQLRFESNDSSENHWSSIYMDTAKLNFKVITTSYAGSNNSVTAYVTFDTTGKILETERYIPHDINGDYVVDLETKDGNDKVIRIVKNVKPDASKHLQDCILLDGVLPPWPNWKDRASPIYIQHFSKTTLDLAELNPFVIGGLNGSAPTSVWYGVAYCDIQFMDQILKIKIPFGYNSLFFNTNDYYSNLQYYRLPQQFEKSVPARMITLDDDVYIIIPA